MVLPFASFSSISGRPFRKFLHTKYQIELVITSHDPKRIYFSENTRINEGLILARKRKTEESAKPTTFINLIKNPDNVLDALQLARDIQRRSLSEWGTIHLWKSKKMETGDWLPSLFYSSEITSAIETIVAKPNLTVLGSFTHVGPAGQGVRGTFDCTPKIAPQAPEYYKALWFHKTNERTKMLVNSQPDCQNIAPKENKEDLAKKLWSGKSNLLVTTRMRLNLATTPAVYVDRPVLGSAWVPVSIDDTSIASSTEIMKALSIWLNSSCGILSFLASRSKNLTYPSFSLDSQKNLLVPNPDKLGAENIKFLADTFDKYKNQDLLPFPQIHLDPVRAELDKAVCQAVGFQESDLKSWREAIAREPSVHNGKPYGPAKP